MLTSFGHYLDIILTCVVAQHIALVWRLLACRWLRLVATTRLPIERWLLPGLPSRWGQLAGRVGGGGRIGLVVYIRAAYGAVSHSSGNPHKGNITRPVADPGFLERGGFRGTCSKLCWLTWHYIKSHWNNLVVKQKLKSWRRVRDTTRVRVVIALRIKE